MFIALLRVRDHSRSRVLRAPILTSGSRAPGSEIAGASVAGERIRRVIDLLLLAASESSSLSLLVRVPKKESLG